MKTMKSLSFSGVANQQADFLSRVTLKQQETSTKVFKNYIEKELYKGSVMGPLDKIQFSSKVGIFLIRTRPQKNTDKRRIIVDISFP